MKLRRRVFRREGSWWCELTDENRNGLVGVGGYWTPWGAWFALWRWEHRR